MPNEMRKLELNCLSILIFFGKFYAEAGSLEEMGLKRKDKHEHVKRVNGFRKYLGRRHGLSKILECTRGKGFIDKMTWKV